MQHKPEVIAYVRALYNDDSLPEWVGRIEGGDPQEVEGPTEGTTEEGTTMDEGPPPMCGTTLLRLTPMM